MRCHYSGLGRIGGCDRPRSGRISAFTSMDAWTTFSLYLFDGRYEWRLARECDVSGTSTAFLKSPPSSARNAARTFGRSRSLLCIKSRVAIGNRQVKDIHDKLIPTIGRDSLARRLLPLLRLLFISSTTASSSRLSAFTASNFCL